MLGGNLEETKEEYTLFESVDNFDPFLQYVRKNKCLPRIKSDIVNSEKGAELLAKLDGAIKRGDYQNGIFSHEYCLMLTQVLYEQEKITRLEKLNVFFYLTILRTFTGRQALRQEDAERLDLSRSAEVSLSLPGDEDYEENFRQILINPLLNVVIIQNEEIIQPASEIIEKINTSDKKISFISEVENKITSNPFEAGIFVIKQRNVAEMDKTILELSEILFVGYIPSFLKEETNTQTLLIGSIALFETYFKQLNPIISFEICPTIGNVSPETLFKDFHRQKKHAVSLYSEHVLSNIKIVHESNANPMEAFVHDLFHIAAFQLEFTPTKYEFYTNEFVPFFVEYYKFIEKCFSGDKEANKIAGEMLEFSNDYLLSGSKFYEDIFSETVKITGDMFDNAIEGPVDELRIPHILIMMPMYLFSQDASWLEYYQINALNLDNREILSLCEGRVAKKLSTWSAKDFLMLKKQISAMRKLKFQPNLDADMPALTVQYKTEKNANQVMQPKVGQKRVTEAEVSSKSERLKLA